MPREQRRIAQQDVEDQTLVRFRARLREGVAVAEVHRHVADVGATAGHLRAEADRDALVRLHADDERVLSELGRVAAAEQVLRRALEDHGDLGHTTAQTLPRPQVEGHIRPATGVDLELDRGVRLRGRLGVHPLLFQEAGDLLATLPSARVLPAGGRERQVVGHMHGREDLLLLGAQVLGRETDRLLHRCQRQQLQQVVLDHVSRGADTVVVPGTPADADVLGHRDLHVVDVVAVPDRLVQFVGEAQGQDVLNRLLAEVVVDAEDRVRGEGHLESGVQSPRGLEIVSEGLLDHDTTPALVIVAVLADETGFLELLRDQREVLRRDRQVERVVAHRPPFDVELLDGVAQLAEGVRVVELTRDEADALQQLGPRLFAERRAGVLLHGVVDDLGEVLVLPVASGESHQGEPGREQTAVREVVDRWHQLLA